MADKKISELTNYTSPIDTDVLPIVDVTAGATKKITKENLTSDKTTAPASSTDNNIATFDGITGKLLKDGGKTIAEVEASSIPATYLDTDGTLTANSDTKVASQKATKTYGDTKLAKTTDVTSINDTGIADGEIAVFNKTNKDIRTSDKVFSTDGVLTGDSDNNIPTEKAVKTYVDGKVTVTASSTTTFSNKRINPRIVTAASYTTDTGTALDVSTCDEFDVTAQAGPLKLNNPSGSPVNGQKLIVRIKDNGTAQNLTYDTQFRASTDLALPSTTVLGKVLYMGFIWDSTDSKWTLLASLNNI